MKTDGRFFPLRKKTPGRMANRLVLGCGTVGSDIVDAIAKWPGDLLVIEPQERRVEALRSDNVPAEHADPTDPAVFEDLEPVDVVLVLGDDGAANREAAALARERFPAAELIAYSGTDPTTEDRDGLETHSDQLLEHGRVVAGHLMTLLAGESGDRLRRLRGVLRDIEGELAVVMHDNPDPDAIASAIALQQVAESVGCPAQVCYFGNITHQENRAFVNLLELDLANLEPDDWDLDAFGGVALVDHSRPGVNDQLPEDTPVDIVIDHHPPAAPVEARFIDLRSDVGATSTLLTEYLRRFGGEIDERVATALLYGIRVDTRDFTREATDADFDSAAYLLPRADTSLLDRVESPQVTGDTFGTIARAIENRQVEDDILATCVGRINNRDALAQAADQLLAMKDISVAMVYGYRDGTVYVSARSRHPDLDLGEALRVAFDPIGSAGGHADMAGAQLPLGILKEVEVDDDEALTTVVEEVIGGRFFETMEDLSIIRRRGRLLEEHEGEGEAGPEAS